MPPRTKRYRLLQGDVAEIVRDLLEPASFHGCLCDPPYGLSFMGKRWDYAVPSVETWREVAGVLVPGAHLLAFAGTRTQHRMAVNIEDAGFEIRDMIAWVYGSGFPKSMDVSKAVDKAAGKERVLTRAGVVKRGGLGGDWDMGSSRDRPRYDTAASVEAEQWSGYGTALKPALEPITVARKPLRGTVAANCLEYGAGAINIDGCRVGNEERTYLPRGTSASAAMVRVPERRAGKAGEEVTTRGRWPANLIHDGSEEVLVGFPDSKGQQGDVRGTEPSSPTDKIYGKFAGRVASQKRNDSGSAARFFYCAKAGKKERGEGNNHPTVKPLALAEYLARLILPPKLDKPRRLLVPFCGSGSEIIGALRAGWDEVVGIDLEESYLEIAKARVDHYLKGAA